jgi:O-antigen/teichoic acid export membrane protein
LVAQVAGVLLSPIFSRLYSPVSYGVVSIYASIVALALSVGALCYETGIPIASDDEDAIGLINVSVVVLITIGLAALLWFSLKSFYGTANGAGQLGQYIWLIPVGVLGGGLYRCALYWTMRRSAFGAIAANSVWQLGVSSGITLGFGVLCPTPLGLILAGICGQVTGIAGLASRTNFFAEVKAWTGRGKGHQRLCSVARKYRRLPLVAAPSTLFNSLGLYLPGIMLAPCYGASFAGQFFMGMKVIGLPITLIAGALNQVFYARAAVVAREQPSELSRFFHKNFLYASICSVSIILVGLTAPWLVPFALGERWQLAGEITLWLSISSAIGLPVSALSNISSIVGRLRGQLIIDAARAVLVFSLLYGGPRLGLGGIATVRIYVLLMVANYIACYLLYRHQVDRVSRTGVTGWDDQGRLNSISVG